MKLGKTQLKDVSPTQTLANRPKTPNLKTSPKQPKPSSEPAAQLLPRPTPLLLLRSGPAPTRAAHPSASQRSALHSRMAHAAAYPARAAARSPACQQGPRVRRLSHALARVALAEHPGPLSALSSSPALFLARLCSARAMPRCPRAISGFTGPLASRAPLLEVSPELGSSQIMGRDPFPPRGNNRRDPRRNHARARMPKSPHALLKRTLAPSRTPSITPRAKPRRASPCSAAPGDLCAAAGNLRRPNSSPPATQSPPLPPYPLLRTARNRTQGSIWPELQSSDLVRELRPAPPPILAVGTPAL